ALWGCRRRLRGSWRRASLLRAWATTGGYQPPGEGAREGECKQGGKRLSRSIIEIECVYRHARVSCPGSSNPREPTMPRGESVFARPQRPEVTLAPAHPEAPAQVPSRQIDSYSGDPNFMMSLARGLIVIQAFTQKKRQLTISQLSAKTGLSRAAVRRCLYTLAQLGFADSED